MVKTIQGIRMVSCYHDTIRIYPRCLQTAFVSWHYSIAIIGAKNAPHVFGLYSNIVSDILIT